MVAGLVSDKTIQLQSCPPVLQSSRPRDVRCGVQLVARQVAAGLQPRCCAGRQLGGPCRPPQSVSDEVSGAVSGQHSDDS